MVRFEHETHSIETVGGVETESFAPDVSGAKQSSLLLVSYNIRYAVVSYLITGSLLRRVGLKLPHRRPRLIERHIKRAAAALGGNLRFPRADVIALQEADKGTVRAGGHHVARELARELRMSYAHASPDLPRGEEPKAKQWYLDFEERIGADETGETGVAFLSRLPLSDVERLELPWSECAWRPRLALAARVRLHDADVHLFNLHIDPHASTDEQLEQHGAVIERADKINAPTVIMGDFNTLSREACVRVRAFLEERGYATPMPTKLATWRAGLIRLHPDWIFVRGLQVSRWGVMKPLGVSDHWPVWAEVEAARA
jgi:endonuclease/exonuclease/phosphatase family metal-dependent hydrolase